MRERNIQAKQSVTQGYSHAHGRLFYLDFDPNKVITVVANSGGTGESHEFSYTHAKVIGNGSFGVVFAARIVGTNEMIAIKKVLQDRRFKVRPRLLVVPRSMTRTNPGHFG